MLGAGSDLTCANAPGSEGLVEAEDAEGFALGQCFELQRLDKPSALTPDHGRWFHAELVAAGDDSEA